MTASCFRGACCAAFRGDLRAPVHPDVGYVALRSEQDVIVDHRYTPGPRLVEVPSSHFGYLANRYVYTAVAEALESFADAEAARRDRAGKDLT